VSICSCNVIKKHNSNNVYKCLKQKNHITKHHFKQSAHDQIRQTLNNRTWKFRVWKINSIWTSEKCQLTAVQGERFNAYCSIPTEQQ
jgi:hypothetical protein